MNESDPILSNAGRWEAVVGQVRLLFGAGRLGELGTLAGELGGRRVLLVSDPGLEAAGHTGSARRSLEGEGLEVAVFTGVESEPTTRHVDDGVGFARDRAAERGVEPAAAFDLVVAVGGGSAMDCAKAINFLLTNGGRMEDYWGSNKARRPLLPALAAPTTAGTGSDAQSYALIADAASGRKMACGDRSARFRAVILDPELVATAPREVAARAGLDALAHAVESLVSRRRNPVSALLAREAWRRIDRDLEEALEPPASIDARGSLLLAAHLAGAAIEASMLGAAHAAANPLTARHRIPHGEAVALMLPAVVRYNAPAADPCYEELAAGGGGAVAERIETLRRRAGLAERLRDWQVDRGALPALARAAANEWTGSFNPRPVTEEDFLRLYEQAF